MRNGERELRTQMAYAGLALGLTLGLGTGIASGARAQAPETASGSTLLMASAEVDQPQQLEIFQGRLQTARVGCPGVDSAILISCEGAEEIWVKAVPGVDVGRYFGQLVAIEGTLRQCGSNRYIDMNTLSPLRRCGDAGATIAPETVNLALGRVDWASPDGGPQGWMGFAADADQASAWTAEGGSAFIRVNLGENRTFNRMRLLWGARHATQYGLYVWDDADLIDAARIDGAGELATFHRVMLPIAAPGASSSASTCATPPTRWSIKWPMRSRPLPPA